MNKTAQHTELDKALFEKEQTPRPRYSGPDQKVLPFEEFNLREDIEESHKAKQPMPTKPLSLKYPELSPEMVRYRELNPKELQRLRDDDDYDYRRHNESYWSRNQPFEPPNKRYFELNKALPEEARQKVLSKYNKFRERAKEFQEKYNEANQIASQEVELDYSGGYIDLFKNFSKFITAQIRKHIGALFGLVPEGGRSNYYGVKARNLAEFINKGINLFNITPFNIETKLHEMESAMHAMRIIVEEYERRKKVLKKLPQVELDVKRYMLKRNNREFLKWMDEYFPNDKKDFMDHAIKEIMETYQSGVGSGLHLGDLKKIRTYSDIWYKAKTSASHNLYFSMQRRVENEIRERLQDTVKERISPKIVSFNEVVNSATPDDMEYLIKYVYKNFKLDLKSVLSFVYSSMIRYYTNRNAAFDAREGIPDAMTPSEGAKEDTEKNFTIFKENFITDLKETVKGLFDAATKNKDEWRLNSQMESEVRDLLSNFTKSKTGIDYKEISKLTEKDINELMTKIFRELILSKLPNFDKPHGYGGYGYALPGFSGIGMILKDTGKFSIDSIVNNIHGKVPFVPKEFILNIVRALIKNQIPDTEQYNSVDKVFQSLYYLNGTSPITTMKVFLDLLKRSGKFNPNSFTNEYVKSFSKIQHLISSFIAEMKDKFSETETMTFFAQTLRNVDTVERDVENIGSFQQFVHNSAGRISMSDMLKMAKNKNFSSYTKVGIVKKIFNIYAQIKNMGGLKGIRQRHGNVINIMQQDGFVSKKFDSNIKFIIKVFNSGQPISPASPFFRKLFEVTSTTETDLQTIEMGKALTEMMQDYQKKDGRLFRLDLQINDNLRFRVLKDKDPRMLRVGIESNCCQRIGGVGENAARDSFINPLAGVLVLEWKNNEREWVLLAQSYFHFVPKDDSFILDNVESNSENYRKSEINLAAAYAYLAQKVKEKFDVKYFIAGKGYSKIDTEKFKTYKLRGGDPRFFDSRSGSRYTDFSPSNSIDLLNPKFDLGKESSKLTGQAEFIDRAFNILLSIMIKTAIIA